MSADQLAIGLSCFRGEGDAEEAQRSLARRLRPNGDAVLDAAVLRVNARHKASVHDPRRVLQGTLTPALTWGVFGLLSGTDRVLSAVIWAVVGAVCGGLYAYCYEHLLTRSELARIGARLRAPSSALLTYVRTSNPAELLQSGASASRTTASVVAVDAELGTRVFGDRETDVEPSSRPAGRPDDTEELPVLSMIMYRYSDPRAAARVAMSLSRAGPADGDAPQVELVVETDRSGHRRVIDPSHGTAAMARSDLVSWGAFGLVLGALAGLAGGGGILGFLEDGVVTGLCWAAFGLVAGALYGLWAGRATTARRLRGLGPLLGRNSSALLAWSDGPVSRATLAAFEEPGCRGLVLRFNPIRGGAVLEAA